MPWRTSRFKGNQPEARCLIEGCVLNFLNADVLFGNFLYAEA